MNFLKNNILALFIIIIIFGSCKSDNTSNSNIENENQQELVFEYKIPEELEYSNHNKDNFIYDKFYPIGWSKTGYLAYITEFSDEGFGYPFFKIFIQNLVNDVIEWEYEAENYEDYEISDFWNNNFEKIYTKLEEYQIVPTETFELGETKFNYSNKEYKIKIFNETQQNPHFGFDVIISTKVELTSPQLGSKTIYEYKEEDYSMLLGQIVSGYILSPFEDRIAVILKNERWGYEGPPNTIYFTIIGSNLTESFQPETKK